LNVSRVHGLNADCGVLALPLAIHEFSLSMLTLVPILEKGVYLRLWCLGRCCGRGPSNSSVAGGRETPRRTCVTPYTRRRHREEEKGAEGGKAGRSRQRQRAIDNSRPLKAWSAKEKKRGELQGSRRGRRWRISAPRPALTMGECGAQSRGYICHVALWTVRCSVVSTFCW
jgi:hypothetical protein